LPRTLEQALIRIKIVQEPSIAGIDGIRLDRFELGKEYEVGNTIAALFLAEGWAETVPLDAPKPFQPFSTEDPFDSRTLYRPQSDLFRRTRSPERDRGRAPDAGKPKRRR
jgi:hypothetical protein